MKIIYYERSSFHFIAIRCMSYEVVQCLIEMIQIRMPWESYRHGIFRVLALKAPGWDHSHFLDLFFNIVHFVFA